MRRLLDWLAAIVRDVAPDPLLRLAGSIRSDLTDVAERHGHRLG